MTALFSKMNTHRAVRAEATWSYRDKRLLKAILTTLVVQNKDYSVALGER